MFLQKVKERRPIVTSVMIRSCYFLLCTTTILIISLLSVVVVVIQYDFHAGRLKIQEKVSSLSLTWSILDTYLFASATATTGSTTPTTNSTLYNSSTTSTTTTDNHNNNNHKKLKAQWNWNPEDIHPCNIRRYTEQEWQRTRLVSSSSSSSSLQQPYPFRNEPTIRNNHHHQNDNSVGDTITLSLTGTTTSTTKNTKQQQAPVYGIVPSDYHEPIIIQRDRTINELFRHKTHRDYILQQFHDQFRVTLSSSNAHSEHRQTMLFRDYLNISYTMEETLPDQRSNESWYLFGETYTPEWQDAILQYYILPPCATCQNNNNHHVALSFGIGNRGSGVQWHIHGPGFSEAVHGRKHWILHPPTPPQQQQPRQTSSNHNNTTSTTNTQIPIHQYDKDQSSRYWMEYVYPFLIPNHTKNDYYECTLDPGDIIYFPNHWWHATINLDRYTAFISTFI